MTQLRRGRHIRSAVRVAGEYGPTHGRITAETDRMAAIYECLRELDGIELIYAIRLPDGIIKIGHTREIMARRRHFDSTPEAILAIKPGTYDEEQAIHEQLAPHRARGREYYHPTPEVLAYVNGIRDDLGVSAISTRP